MASSDIPIYLGKVSDVANDLLVVGYAFPQALLSADLIYSKANVYDRAFGGMQLKVEPSDNDGVVIVTPLDIDRALQLDLEVEFTDDTTTSHRSRAMEVYRYAKELSTDGAVLRVSDN